MISDLAELEAKAKALAGTQHWRGLDPDAVLEALDEVKRLRAENTVLKKHLDLYEVSDNLVIKNEDEIERLRAEADHQNDLRQQLSDSYKAKLAKARTALSKICIGADLHVVRETARQALKEIDE